MPTDYITIQMATDSKAPIPAPISVPLLLSIDKASSPRYPPSLQLQSKRDAVGNAILRGYATYIDPLQTNGETHASDSQPASLHPSTANNLLASYSEDTSHEESHDTAAATLLPLRLSKTLPTHRKFARSTDIPHQTIMKALASRGQIPPPLTAPLRAAFNTRKASDAGDYNKDTQLVASPCLSASLAGWQMSTISPLSATTALLRSPCFFHQRLSGAVDMQKLLEDISDDDFSHSRLMQTTTMIRESAKKLQRRPLKKAVRSVMIVTKAKDNKLIYLTRELTEWLLSTPRYGNDLGVKVYVDAKLRHSKRFDAAGLVQKEPRFEQMLNYWSPDLCWSNPDLFDLVLTLGGDGTVLFTSWLFQRTVPPILSFSMGSLGFLTNFAFDDYQQLLDRVMGDAGMRINLRMRFTCTVFRTDRSADNQNAVIEGEQFEVLNELVIDRGPSPYVSNLELWGDDALLTRVQADGCILSTPTGSTAYSLSAGGALVHPDIPAILLTPICPHTLSFRPMLLSDAVALRIVVPAKSRSASVYCSFDGKGRVELNRGDYVTLEASQYPFPTVMTGPNEWLESVQRSLHWNVRSAEQRAWEEGLDEEGGGGAENGGGEAWDIDTDSTAYGGADSGLGQSEDGEFADSASPMRRQMSLLNM